MKRLFFCLIALSFISCSNGYWTGDWDYTFTNKSSVTVSFKVDNNDTMFTLASGETITINMNNKDNYSLYNHPRVNVEKTFKNGKGYYDIYDLTCINQSVFNSSEHDIILSENNGLLGEKYGDTVLLKAGQTTDIKVYTSSPSYKAIFADNYYPADLSLLSFVMRF